MKKIEIKGKHNKDKITKANDPNNATIVAVRDCMQNMPIYVFDCAFQILLINKIYLNLDIIELDLNLESIKDIKFTKECLREIDKKIASYKNQDIHKKKYDENNITRAETIEKLVVCKLKCYYCKSEMLIFYNKVRDQTQWTLDRIDNNLPHSNKNVIISCLKCNLQRRCQSKDKFLFTKQLKIVKEKI